jgi:hypothetical protein
MRARNRLDSLSDIRSKGLQMEDLMSAAVAWDVAPAPARIPARPARPSGPRLVSVPCGDEILAAPGAPLRLTRAGRLAITMTLVVVAVVVALGLATARASATVIDHSTTVRAGQTLSEIAARELPQLPVADAVARLEVVNDLVSAEVHAGQALLIPAVG